MKVHVKIPSENTFGAVQNANGSRLLFMTSVLGKMILVYCYCVERISVLVISDHSDLTQPLFRFVVLF